MFLGLFQRLVRVHLKEGDIENLSGRIAGTIVVLGAGADSARRHIGRIFAGPYVRFHPMLQGRGERSTPYCRLSFLAFGIGSDHRFQTIGLRITSPTTRGNVEPLEGGASGDEFRSLGL